MTPTREIIMATIRKVISLAAPVEQVWDVIRDVGAIHTRFAPGFVVGTRMEEAGVRIVTFANGLVVRELIITVDDQAHRLAYSISGGAPTHHNASFQVFPAAAGHSSLVWITDLLPDTLAANFTAIIEAGSNVIKRTLNATRPSPPAREM
jgi:hypothetical protein